MHHPLDQNWRLIQEHLRRAVPPAAYDLWLGQLEARDLVDQRLVLAAADERARWVADRFSRVLQTSAAAVLGPDVEVEVVGRSQVPRRSPERRCEPPKHGFQLNPDYTFGNFVIGEGNRLAHAAALAVAESPGQAYNPLFICGPPGVGKTHLLHSIAAYAQSFGGVSVRCVTADAFTSSFVRALHSGAIDRFKSDYRSTGMLLVDDVQFLQDKARTEEEFFHTFNALYEAGAQIVLTSDRPPANIDALEERLRERFAAGLVTQIAVPEFETRLTLLRKWARQEGARGVGEETLAVLASRFAGNVRSLRGALTHLVAMSSLQRRPLGLDMFESLVGDRARAAAEQPPPTVEQVQELTCRVFGLSREELVSASRTGRVAWPRQLAMYLAREHTGATTTAIGRAFGGRDHTTVLYAHRQASRRVAQDPRARAAALRLVESLRSPAGDRGD